MNLPTVSFFENPSRPAAERTASGQAGYTCVSGGTYLNLIGLPEGPGYCLGGRYFDKEAGKLYWNDGTITELEDGVERFGWAQPDGVRYSEWDDAKRAEVRAECERKRKEWEIENERREREWQEVKSKHDALVESARAKLTPEEFEAVKEEGADEVERY